MERYPGGSAILAGPSVRSVERGSRAGGDGCDIGAGLGSLIESLRGHRRLGRELVHHAHLPAVPPAWGGLDPPLPPPLAAALAAGGVQRLWRHQTEAIAAARAGEDVLVTTPTASGKSLVFQAPVLEEALRGGDGRALFLFPLKALGQDQKGKLDRLAAAAGLGGRAGGDAGDADAPPPFSAIYDGDTPRTDRARIKRDPPRVLITNPDMLHLAVLGYHDGWRHLLGSLRWIVLDELHTYRGIFGSHFHHVLQRLLRLCRDAGGNPALIASSATAANAGEFARALTGRRFRWIAESGAPREGRHLLLFRPEASPYTTALALFTRLLRAGLKTIVFTKARRITELLYSWLRRQEPELARRVASYRAGFLPEERRRIEADLFAGRLDGVISTSALEMGIDVGGLDACILVGFPGSIMATWQRSGRVGRDGRDSLTALVALPDALDQYFLDHPAELLGRPCEQLVVDPGNRPVARAHLVCAAAERPLRPRAAESEGGDAGYLAPHGGLVGEMVAAGELLESVAGDELCSLRRHPERGIGLRGIGATYRIVHRRGDRERTIGTVDGVRVFHECHPGAVYLHVGSQYLVTELDVEERRALAEPADLDYFTNPLTEKETEILEVLEERRDGPLAAWLGRVRVTERVVGFERKRIQGQEVIDQQAPRAAADRVRDGRPLVGGAAGDRGDPARRRRALHGRAPRRRARGDLALPAARALRPRRHRRHLDAVSPAGRLRRSVRLRRPPGRRRHRRARGSSTSPSCSAGCTTSSPAARARTAARRASSRPSAATATARSTRPARHGWRASSSAASARCASPRRWRWRSTRSSRARRRRRRRGSTGWRRRPRRRRRRVRRPRAMAADGAAVGGAGRRARDGGSHGRRRVSPTAGPVPAREARRR